MDAKVVHYSVLHFNYFSYLLPIVVYYFLFIITRQCLCYSLRHLCILWVFVAFGLEYTNVHMEREVCR